VGAGGGLASLGELQSAATKRECTMMITATEGRQMRRTSSADGTIIVLRAATAYGSVGRGGELGYDGLRVCTPSGWPEYRTISAHAPSQIEILTTEPLAVAGFMNLTSRRRGESRFWVDENWLGDLYFPGDRTNELILDPGVHQLHVTAQHHGYRHTIWGLRPVEFRNHPRDVATPENTAVVAIAAYERSVGRNVCQFLTASARRNGVYLHFRGLGEPYDHFESKIVKLHGWIDELPERFSYVLYVDARDVIFLRDLDVCCRALNQCGRPILIGAERWCWPVGDAGWRDGFPTHATNRRWPNAGVFMGRRRELNQALSLLRGLSEKENFPAYAKRRDDQFLWQWAWLHGLASIAVDYECSLVANINTHDTQLGERNSDFAFTSGLVVRDSGARPALAHFSGGVADEVMHMWAGFLGVV
jgi:hypothetical protein